jgi:hypothetical protein
VSGAGMIDTAASPTCTKCSELHQKCSGHNTRGRACGGLPIKGATTCRIHTPHSAKGKAAVRYAISQWSPEMRLEDPGTVLLRMVTIAWNRWREIAAELAAAVEAAGSIEKAMTGTAYTVEGGRSGEYIKGLPMLEAEWSKRAMEWSAAAVKAGLDERRVRMAEQLGMSLIAFTDGLLAALGARFGFDPADPSIRELVQTELVAIEGNPAK